LEGNKSVVVGAKDLFFLFKCWDSKREPWWWHTCQKLTSIGVTETHFNGYKEKTVIISAELQQLF